jgi:hypothetical protein
MNMYRARLLVEAKSGSIYCRDMRNLIETVMIAGLAQHKGLARTLCPYPRHRDGLQNSENTSGQPLNISLGVVTQHTPYAYQRDHVRYRLHCGHIYRVEVYRTLLEGYPPWVRPWFCDHHKRTKKRERHLPCWY